DVCSSDLTPRRRHDPYVDRFILLQIGSRDRGAASLRHDLHIEDLFHAGFEFEKRHALAAARVDHHDCAFELFAMFRDRNTAEHRRLTNAREPDESIITSKGQAARIARHRRYDIAATTPRINDFQRAMSRVEHPQAPAVYPRRMRHRQSPYHRLARSNVDQATAGGLRF